MQAISEVKPNHPSDQFQSREQIRERFEVLTGLRKFVHEYRHVLLVGKPGSGKSTALRRLLWEEAQTALEAGRSQDKFTIPVLIELRDRQPISVLERIGKSLRRLRLSPEAIEDLLFEGRLFLLFDGVNELPSPDAWAALDEFRRDQDFHSTPMIFTTRELGAGADLSIEKKLEMVPLTESQMRDFIQKRLPQQADNLLRQLQDRLRELAETPLLLQMLCDVVAESRDGQIPQNRGELFRQEFARRYEKFKPLRGRVSEDSRRFAPELLQHLAFVMTQGDPHTDPLKPTSSLLTLPKSQAETVLEGFLTNRVNAPAQAAKEWLEDLLEHHLLQLASDSDEIEFHHQLFQEYYAAEALLQKLPDISDYTLKRDFLNYLKWTEAIALMLGLSEITYEQAEELVKLALEVDLLFGAKLVGQVKEPFQYFIVALIITQPVCQQLKIKLLSETRSEVAAWKLSKLFEEVDSSSRNDVLDALIKMGGTAIVLAAVKAFDDPELRGKAFLLFGLSEPAQSIEILSKAVEHPDPDIRWGATLALVEINSEEAIQILLKALENSDFDVQFSAAFALGTLGFEVAIPILKQAIDLAESTDTCRMAISALAGIDSEETVLLFRQLTQNPDLSNLVTNVLMTMNLECIAPRFRETFYDIRTDFQNKIVKSLDSEETLSSLERALKDSRPNVVKSAAILLKETKKFHPRMLNTLWEHQVKLYEEDIAETISAIQKRYGFYNYEIAQSVAEEGSGVSGVGCEEGAKITYKTYNISSVGILNTGNVTVHGDQKGTHSLPPNSDTTAVDHSNPFPRSHESNPARKTDYDSET
ncbi:HEAT repeat domain-containing protein [Kovacikia minuta CCNUW1]|uniref:HEAT repeat domain-containing protein n=1 Tax=Kovacikia minuta TaxID=2931930 RepID=UPI001CCCD874|nr:HEAT repeat domain-containing protein [Kovacikia minuta]UBF29521.1 HEAT repeat domain-containing protein [Kovacikia minuta CCNUW1]